MTDRSFLIPLAILAACVAGTISLPVTKWVREFFLRRAWVDRPNEARKLQKHAVAYGGGTAILISASVTLTLVFLFVQSWYAGTIVTPTWIGLITASVLMWAVGLYDDVRNMRGTTKLGWQLVAAGLVVFPGIGIHIQRVALLGTEIPLGYLGIPIAMVWILAAINSLNLLDGMDGLAGTVGMLLSLTIGLMAISTGRVVEAAIAFALAGSLIGFLRLNWAPAKIYLGDSGSMLIGLILGTLAIRCEVKDAASMAIAAPLAMFAIPLIDSAAAIVRRKATGRSMYSTDRGHIHHRLHMQGLTSQQTVGLIVGLCSITCLGGLLDVYFRGPFPFGMIAVIIVVLMLLSNRIFGNSELTLVKSRLSNLARRLLPAGTPRSSSVRLQGTLEWESVWQEFLDSTHQLDLVHLRLNLHLPDLHEDFYASWRHRRPAQAQRRWTVELPLIYERANIGTLTAQGLQTESTVAPNLIDFSDAIQALENELGQIIARERESRRSPEPALAVSTKPG